jgi:hypothetical protein
MCFDFLYWYSGLCLSCGVCKLNWWNLVSSISGGVDVFSWVWCLLCFTLGSGGVWSFALRNLVFWLLSSWVWNLMFATHMAWFERELVIYLILRGSWWFCLVYCIFCFSLEFSSYSSKSLCFWRTRGGWMGANQKFSPKLGLYPEINLMPLSSSSANTV